MYRRRLAGRRQDSVEASWEAEVTRRVEDQNTLDMFSSLLADHVDPSEERLKFHSVESEDDSDAYVYEDSDDSSDESTEVGPDGDEVASENSEEEELILLI